MRFAALALLFPSAAAIRSFVDADADEAVTRSGDSEEAPLTFSGDATMICKRPEIWHEITQGASSSFDLAMNIHWEKIEALKKASIDESKAQAKVCKDALDTLSSTLKGKLGDQLPTTTEEQITSLLEAGLGDDSFKGSAQARDFKCGKLRRLEKSGTSVRLPRRAYRKSLAAFKEASTAFFSKKEFRLDGDLFHKVCHRMLVGDDARMATYCVNLCQEFRDEAQSRSNEMVGESAGDADKLKDEIKSKQACLNEHTTDAQNCENDWASLVPFRDQLAELKTTYGDRFRTLQAADRALDDALGAFDALEDSVKGTEEELVGASKLLTTADQATADAKASVAGAVSQKANLKGKMQATRAELAKLSNELKDAQEADDLMGRLKDIVVNVMLMMERFTEAALRDPIRQIGFVEYPDKFSFQEPETLASSGATRDDVETLHGFCVSTAMPAFEDMKEMIAVDLTPLCELAQTDIIMEDLSGTVKAKAELIKSDMTRVVSWLSPYRAQKLLTKQQRAQGEEAEDKLISEGQLANLEKVKSVYFGSSHFYKYLLGWRKDGPHHMLIAKLTSLIKSLEAKVTVVENKLAALKDEAAAAQAAHQEAVDKMQKAVAAQSAASAEKGRLEGALSDLQAKGQKMRSDISELEARVAKAKKDVATAVDALAVAYSEGTGTALVELQAEEDQSQQRIQELERAIASNDDLYEEMSRRK